MATVTLDPWLVKWIEEWVQHQKLRAQIERLGEPKFVLPPAPIPWDLPVIELQASMDRDELHRVASEEIDQELRRIDEHIETLEAAKSEYRRMLDRLS